MRLPFLLTLLMLLCVPAAATGGPGHERGHGHHGHHYNDSDSDSECEECEECPVFEDSFALCHIPPGNPSNAHQITVSVNALEAHFSHGDVLGECPGCLVDEECDNQLYCDGPEDCVLGECVTGEGPCHEGEICSELDGTCIPPPGCQSFLDCDNGFFCDGQEHCIEGTCVPGFWPCYLGQACVEDYHSCLWLTIDAGVVGDSGTSDLDAGEEGAGSPPSTDDAGPPAASRSLSGSSFISCSSTGGEPWSALFLLALVLFGLKYRKGAAVAAVLMLSVPAYAEGADHFTTASDPNGYLVTNDSVPLKHLETSGWVMSGYAYSPLVIRDENGQIVEVIVRHQFKSQFALSIGLWDWVQLGIGAPSYYLLGPELNTLALGDPRVFGQVKLTPWDKGLVASLRLESDFPLARLNGVGLARSVTGDPLPTITPSFTFGFNHDWFKVGAEVGHTFRSPKSIGPATIGSGLNYSAAGELFIIPDRWSVLTDVYGTLNYPSPIFSDLFTSRFAYPVEAAIGTKIRLGPFVVTGGLGTGVLADYGTSAARVFAGIGWEPLPPEEPHECIVCKPCEECEATKTVVKTVYVTEAAPEPKKQTKVNSTLVILRPDRIEILDPIHFEFDSDVIRSESYIILKNVAMIIRENPEIRMVNIEGHTDDVGSLEYNLNLSERRAYAVMKHLVDKGKIEPERLSYQGFGEGKPIVENDFAENRARNRRVEFVIVTRSVEIPVEKEAE